jgi:hypothetical protein
VSADGLVNHGEAVAGECVLAGEHLVAGLQAAAATQRGRGSRPRPDHRGCRVGRLGMETKQPGQSRVRDPDEGVVSGGGNLRLSPRGQVMRRTRSICGFIQRAASPPSRTRLRTL